MPVPTRMLGDCRLPVSRLGLGLAAVGRPGYITLGRGRDLPSVRSPEALYRRCAELLDAALSAGIRYVDAARSYGRAEEFLARWLGERRIAAGTITVGSKWGYRYTAGWTVDAVVHEEKELSVERFRAQLEESRALLGAHLALYQIHSATAESGALGDAALLAALVDGRRRGAYRAVGLTLSGPTSARALDLALDARSDGERVFDTVQATFNALEPSLAPLLARAHGAGMGVIVKEAVANGRLTEANGRAADAAIVRRLRDLAQASGLAPATLAIAYVLAHPFVDVVLSGAATVAQLASHAAAAEVVLDPGVVDALTGLGEPPQTYWRTRASLPWT